MSLPPDLNLVQEFPYYAQLREAWGRNILAGFRNLRYLLTARYAAMSLATADA